MKAQVEHFQNSVGVEQERSRHLMDQLAPAAAAIREQGGIVPMPTEAGSVETTHTYYKPIVQPVENRQTGTSAVVDMRVW